MKTVYNVLTWAGNLARSGMGVDKDGYAGMQCVDLVSWPAKHFFGVDLWGNARDLLDSAAGAGWMVVYAASNLSPEPGACFVMDYWAGGVNYGHTGLVIANLGGGYVETVEQNLAGNLDHGSPAQFHRRHISDLVGWFYPPYEADNSDHTVVDSSAMVPETGKFTIGNTSINVRRAPSLLGEVVDVYEPGEEVYYDHKVLASDGYRWISFVGGSGHRNYMAIAPVDADGNRIGLWGEIE